MRDVNGNTLAIYQKIPTQQEANLLEQHIYGSARLGQYRPKQNTKPTALGQRIYEFSNHLGNVLVTLSDNKIPQTEGTYASVVVSASDYYPFGLAMKERTFSNGNYRYGFNGQEQSDELDPEGNSYTAEFWQYDSKIARRWNVDPVNKTHESSYLAFAGNPIWFIDLNGADTSVYDKGYKKELIDGSDWVWKPVPTEVLKGGDDVFLLEHEEGTIERGGKKYIELWSEYSLWGNDYDLNNGQGTDGILINNFMPSFIKYLEDKKVFSYTDGQIQDASSVQGTKIEAWGMTLLDFTDYSESGKQGILDIAFNAWLFQFAQDEGGTVTGGSTNSLFLINGKYASGNETGNYAIGYGSGYSGYKGTSIPLLANIFSLFKGRGLDDSHEQKILKKGISDGTFHRKVLIWQSDMGWTPHGNNENSRRIYQQTLKTLERQLQGK